MKKTIGDHDLGGSKEMEVDKNKDRNVKQKKDDQTEVFEERSRNHFLVEVKRRVGS